MTIQLYNKNNQAVTQKALLFKPSNKPHKTVRTLTQNETLAVNAVTDNPLLSDLSPRESALFCDTHGALGKSTKFASVASKHESHQTKHDNFKARLNLQDEVRKLVPDSRTSRACLRLKIPSHDYVTVMTTQDSARFGGLAVCDNVWACPVCSAKIWGRRGLELEKALATAKALGYTVTMLTFTLSHVYTDSLKSLNDDLMKAYRSMFSGSQGQAIKKAIQYVGSIKVYETRHAYSNGWHSHLHVLFITESPLSESYPEHRLEAGVSGCEFSLETMLKNRWIHMLKNCGRSASFEHGLHFAESDKEIFEYITKQSNLPLEITNGNNKKSKSRSPIELLADSADGDKESGVLWVEYYKATHGLKALVYSKGIKELLAIESSDDSTDESDNKESAVYALFEVDLWREVIRIGGAGTRSRILTIAQHESVYHLALFLHRTLGIAWSRAITIYPDSRDIKFPVTLPRKGIQDWDLIF